MEKFIIKARNYNQSLTGSKELRESKIYAKYGAYIGINNCKLIADGKSIMIYETGATTHATNDLILFTDNTRELAQLRDEIFKDVLKVGYLGTRPKWERFIPLEKKARERYIKELKAFSIKPEEQKEFCQLYVEECREYVKENN